MGVRLVLMPLDVTSGSVRLAGTDVRDLPLERLGPGPVTAKSGWWRPPPQVRLLPTAVET